MGNALLAQISKLVNGTPLPLIENLAARLETLGERTPDALPADLLQTIPQPKLRSELQQLFNLWCVDKGRLDLLSLAFALRTAAQVAEDRRQAENAALVWTGPSAGGPAMRSTEQALLEIINRAQHSLLIVSFAVYNIPRIRASLLQAAQRNVRIQLCVESSEHSQGKIAYTALHALQPTLAANTNIYIWPSQQRLRNAQGQIGALHVKCAVADSQSLFLSSANLTEHALTLNMELGLLIHGGPLPIAVATHFQHLIENHILVKLE